MKNLLYTPGIPENKVITVLLSSQYPKFAEILENKYDIDVIAVQHNSKLTDDISTHGDCVFLQLNKDTLIIDKSIVNFFTIGDINYNLFISNKEVKSPYPHDVLLNACVISDKIICNTKHIDDKVASFAQEHSCRLIHCNQGYAACSTIVLNSNALITDDESIFRVAANNGIDCILISKGSVRLESREYGFIGGTCGMIDKNLLAFTGSIDQHSDSDLIKSFLFKHNISYVELSDGPLLDIGGIIPVFEESYTI